MSNSTGLADHRSPARPDAEAAFQLARSLFLQGRRITVQVLIAELGISRVTLFRWVGNRDQLLAEVLWSVAEPTFSDAVRHTRGRGAQRIAGVVGRFCAALIDASFFRAFLQREPERALRILTTRAGGIQSRMLAAVEELLVTVADEDGLALPLPPRDLAYVLVRLGESFVYTDLITGERPDAAKAEAAAAALLGCRPTAGTLG